MKRKRKSNRGGSRPGAGRPALPPENRRVRLSIMIAPDTDQKIWNYCETHNMSAGELIDDLVLNKFVTPPPEFDK